MFCPKSLALVSVDEESGSVYPAQVCNKFYLTRGQRKMMAQTILTIHSHASSVWLVQDVQVANQPLPSPKTITTKHLSEGRALHPSLHSPIYTSMTFPANNEDEYNINWHFGLSPFHACNLCVCIKGVIWNDVLPMYWCTLWHGIEAVGKSKGCSQIQELIDAEFKMSTGSM